MTVDARVPRQDSGDDVPPPFRTRAKYWAGSFASMRLLWKKSANWSFKSWRAPSRSTLTSSWGTTRIPNPKCKPSNSKSTRKSQLRSIDSSPITGRISSRLFRTCWPITQFQWASSRNNSGSRTGWQSRCAVNAATAIRPSKNMLLQRHSSKFPSKCSSSGKLPTPMCKSIFSHLTKTSSKFQ